MRLLTRLAKQDNLLQDYLDEKMYFEAYIYASRECPTTWQELDHDLEKEMSLKNPKITMEDYDSIQCEMMDLLRSGDLVEGEIIWD